MKNTLRQRLTKYFRDRSAMVFSGGEMERFVSARTDYKPSTISRRLREMAEDGLLVATYKKGTVFYQWNSNSLSQFVTRFAADAPILQTKMALNY